MATRNLEKASARERLLAAADQLFYQEGVHSVGIDRVIERADVAKATLYSAFGSKDELVRAYLNRRHEARRERITKRLATIEAPRERILAVFDVLGEAFAQPKFRGCAFLNARAESAPGTAAYSTCETARAWVRSLFKDLAQAAGARDPEHLARKLVPL